LISFNKKIRVSESVAIISLLIFLNKTKWDNIKKSLVYPRVQDVQREAHQNNYKVTGAEYSSTAKEHKIKMKMLRTHFSFDFKNMLIFDFIFDNMLI